MSGAQQQYWFRGKRYGWGWGLPATWQGWVVLLTWGAVMALAGPILALHSLPLFFAFVGVMAAALVAIGFAKGEPPRWRWGK